MLNVKCQKGDKRTIEINYGQQKYYTVVDKLFNNILVISVISNRNDSNMAKF